MRRQQPMGWFTKVVFTEYFKTGELNRFPKDVIVISAEFEYQFAPAIHVYYHLYLRLKPDLMVLFDHALREAMYKLC